MATYGSVANGRRLQDDEVSKIGSKPVKELANYTGHKLAEVSRLKPSSTHAERLKRVKSWTYGSAGDPVGKRLGVQPVLARVRPAAGRGGRRIVTGTVGKGWRADKTAPGAKAALEHLQVQSGLRQIKRLPPVNGTRQSLTAPKNERLSAATQVRTVGKAFNPAGAMSGLKNAGSVMRGGFKAGLNQYKGVAGAAAKPRMGLGASVAAGRSSTLSGLGRAAMTAGKNPLASGAIAGGGIGAAAMAGNGQRDKPTMYAPPPSPIYGMGGFGKGFRGPSPRLGSYKEWSSQINSATGSGQGVGPKTLARAKEMASPGGDAKQRRAFAIWQRDNNKMGAWVGNSPAGKHQTADDSKRLAGIARHNSRQQGRENTARWRETRGEKSSPPKNRGRMLYRDGLEAPADYMQRVGKRHYDPEGERRFRQGAAATGTGAAGLGLGAYALREGRAATRTARSGAPMASKSPGGGRPVVATLEAASGAGKLPKVIIQDGRAVHVADRLKRGGLATTRRGAVAGVGALGLLGASGALVRNRNEERWD